MAPNAIGSADCGTALLGWFFRLFNRSFDFASDRYARSVGWLVRRAFIAILVYGGLVALTVYGFQVVPRGFIPAQDKGYLITAFQLPDGASLERTDKVVHDATKMMMDTPGVRYCVGFAGFSAPPAPIARMPAPYSWASIRSKSVSKRD